MCWRFGRVWLQYCRPSSCELSAPTEAEERTYRAGVGVLQDDSAFAVVADVVDQDAPLLVVVVAGAVELGDLAESRSSPLNNRPLLV